MMDEKPKQKKSHPVDKKKENAILFSMDEKPKQKHPMKASCSTLLHQLPVAAARETTNFESLANEDAI